jgi:hypothetical protein
LPPPGDRETPRARRPAQPETTSRARTDTAHTALRNRTTSLPLERSRHLARPIPAPKRRDKPGSAPRCLPVLPPRGARQVTTSPHEMNVLRTSDRGDGAPRTSWSALDGRNRQEPRTLLAGRVPGHCHVGSLGRSRKRRRNNSQTGARNTPKVLGLPSRNRRNCCTSAPERVPDRLRCVTRSSRNRSELDGSCVRTGAWLPRLRHHPRPKPGKDPQQLRPDGARLPKVRHPTGRNR